MLQFLKTYQKLVLAVVLILGSSYYWIANTKTESDRRFDERVVVTLTAPVQRLVTGVVDGIKHVWYGYFYFVGLRAGNDGLRDENDRLRGELAAEWETAGENERLREMLAFQKETHGTLLASSVIAADSMSFAKSLRIDRGSRHGVGRNMAVVTPSGVVGRVVEVGPFHADVQLLTDGRSAVPVRVQRTRACFDSPSQ
jgi:rod shape-determining protein MreC